MASKIDKEHLYATVVVQKKGWQKGVLYYEPTHFAFGWPDRLGANFYSTQGARYPLLEENIWEQEEAVLRPIPIQGQEFPFTKEWYVPLDHVERLALQFLKVKQFYYYTVPVASGYLRATRSVSIDQLDKSFDREKVLRFPNYFEAK